MGSGGSSSEPRAYLNYILFDQDFNRIAYDTKRVNDSTDIHQKPELSVNITKGGYIYIWLSNESSAAFDVYFDDLRITHNKGSILQEDHYYPFGGSIAALSSTAPLSKPNPFKFNAGTEFNTSFDLNFYDTPYRGYAPQLGRFAQVDALADFFSRWNPYQFGYDNPIIWNDPLGLAGNDGNNGNDQGEGGGTQPTVADMINYAWTHTGKDESAMFEFIWNPWGGDEVYREFTDNGVNIYYEGETLVKKTSHTKGKNGEILSDVSRMIAIAGTAWGAYEEFRPRPTTYLNPNGKVRPLFKPSGKFYSRMARREYVNGVKAVRGFSYILATGGVIFDGIGVINYYYDPKSNFTVHPAKAALNTIMTAIALWGGPIGWAVSGGYFIVDATVGWENAAELMSELDQNHQRVTGKSLYNRSGIY